MSVARSKRKLGACKGTLRMSEDFDAPLPEEELAAWLGPDVP